MNIGLPVTIHDLRSVEKLRAEVRAFLADESEKARIGGSRIWDLPDAEFSRRLGARGWIGMTWPAVYGGRSATPLERFVVIEELVSFGAPVWAHHLADRQVGPMILNYGTEAQKMRFLPRIVAGECFICVGMSEPDAGSDLSAVRTTATRESGGWRISGRKVWTSYAHISHYISVFARSGKPDPAARHSGFSQFIVDLTSPGITIRPIVNIAARHDLNEVVFDNVFVSDDALIGQAGDGWSMVTNELVHERSGPERWLSSYPLVRALVDRLAQDAPEHEAAVIGRMVAHLWGLRRMSLSLVGSANHDADKALKAALVKDVGTVFDQSVPDIARSIVSETVVAGNDEPDQLRAMLEHITLHSPSYSLRGGTPEVLRGIVAKGYGLR